MLAAEAAFCMLIWGYNYLVQERLKAGRPNSKKDEEKEKGKETEKRNENRK